MQERPVKKTVPVYKPDLCTDCLVCQITCALLHGGTSSVAAARIRPRPSSALRNPVVMVSAGCDCPDGAETCERVCGPMALRFIPPEELLVAARDGWQASPVDE